jgi:uncharacterized membrane protein YesL
MNIDWIDILKYLTAYAGTQVINKIIRDNLPNYHRKEVLQRWKERMVRFKAYLMRTKLYLMALWVFILLMLNHKGWIKLNQKSVFPMLCLLLLMLALLYMMRRAKPKPKS